MRERKERKPHFAIVRMRKRRVEDWLDFTVESSGWLVSGCLGLSHHYSNQSTILLLLQGHIALLPPLITGFQATSSRPSISIAVHRVDELHILGTDEETLLVSLKLLVTQAIVLGFDVCVQALADAPTEAERFLASLH